MILSWLIVCMTIVSNDLQESIMRWFLSPGPGHDSSLVSDHLSSSQLPVWTIYAEKICVPTTSQLKCEASWAFEMVSDENISKRSERKRKWEHWQFLAVEPSGPVNISRYSSLLRIKHKDCHSRPGCVKKCPVFCFNWVEWSLSLRDISWLSSLQVPHSHLALQEEASRTSTVPVRDLAECRTKCRDEQRFVCR